MFELLYEKYIFFKIPKHCYYTIIKIKLSEYMYIDVRRVFLIAFLIIQIQIPAEAKLVPVTYRPRAKSEANMLSAILLKHE